MPVSDIVSRSTACQAGRSSCVAACSTSISAPQAAASTAYSRPTATAPSSPAITATTRPVTRASRGCHCASAVRGRWRARQPTIASESASTSAPGTRAARITSCVLTMRTAAWLAFTASVWARIMASPSSSSTSEGGTTTPSVPATHSVAAAAAGGVPLAARRGAMLRESMCRLAPTEPFIGASSAPTASADISGAAPKPRSSDCPPRCICAASGRRFRSAPTSAYSGSACSRSFSSRPTRRGVSAPSRPRSKAPLSTPPAANSAATASSTAYTGRPLKTMPASAQASIARPVIRRRRPADPPAPAAPTAAPAARRRA